MPAPLRPMSLGEILDRTFELYRKRFLLFAGIAALPAAAMLGVRLADALWWHIGTLVHPMWRPGVFMWGFLLSLGFYHVDALLVIPFYPALVNSASRAAFDKQDSALRSMRVFAARWRSFAWVGILRLIADLLIPEIVAAIAVIGIGMMGSPIYFDSHPNSPLIAVLVFAVPATILIVLFLWFGACFSLAFPAAVFERTVGMKAMRRSWDLSRNSRGRIVAVWLMIAIFSWILMFGLQFLYRWGMVSTHAWPHLSSAWRMAYFAGAYSLNAIVVALLGPLYPIAITLIYYDQRIRREGFDIEKMMEAAGLGEVEAPAGAAALVQTEPQETQA